MVTKACNICQQNWSSHGSLLETTSWIKTAKKELLFRDTSLSGSTVASSAMQTMAETHSALVATQKEFVAEVANQTLVQSIKEQMAGEQMKCTIYQGMGNDNAVLRCLSQIEILQAELAAVRAEPTAGKARAVEEERLVEEVDLTGEDLFLNQAPSNEEVDLTHVEVDDSSEAEDNEAEQDVEEMYTTAKV
jgi:hypothetical protein